jgi:hypothetical protein
MFAVPTVFPGAETAGARVMAEAWADYYTALWRGDPAASAFAEWLAGFWEPSLQRPAGAADARSPYITGGGAIDWFEREGWVSGHVPGQSGGYLLPRAIVLDYPWVTLEEPAA